MSTSHTTLANPDNAFLWQVIGRFDEYVRAADTKAAVVATFGVFEFGVALEATSDAVEAGGGLLLGVALLSLGLCIALALVGLGTLASAVLPNLTSPEPTDEYTSVLFFGDVAADADGVAFGSRLTGLDEAAVARDLAHQAHALAGIARHKYRRLTRALQFVVGAGGCLAVGLLFDAFL